MIKVFVTATSSHCDCMHLQIFVFSVDVISGLACRHVLCPMVLHPMAQIVNPR